VDPLTQGLLGAAAAQALLGRRFPRAWLVGAVGGMAPDLDVLIGSSTDPLLSIEYHRQFTHALAFVPVGGPAAALPWMALRRARRRWREVVLASTAGYATHGLLDACTTYGTQLFWPFSGQRVAWSWISIIDPVFTLALLAGVALAARAASRRPVVLALAFAALYLGAGALQHARALGAQERIAAARGHDRVRGDAFPAFGSNRVWRSLYLAGDTLYLDRVRVGWTGGAGWMPGSAVALVREEDLGHAERRDPRVVRDFRRFRRFSDGWVARAPTDHEVVGDARYSLTTDVYDPVWGVRFSPGEPVPTEWVDRTRDRSLGLGNPQTRTAGTRSGYRPLPRRRVTGRARRRSRRGGPWGPGRGRTPPAHPATAT
jgi:inner membrane protein